MTTMMMIFPKKYARDMNPSHDPLSNLLQGYYSSAESLQCEKAEVIS